MIREAGDALDVFGALLFFFASLLFSIYQGISILGPLVLGLIIFVILALRRGYGLAGIGRMLLQGSKKSLIVIRIFVLIGAITAVWRACGTVAFIVYHGIALMSAQFFVLYAFLLSAGVSFLMGTSFGTAATVGVVLTVLAQSGGVDINVAAGAILAGAYFGDRGSPMSSSAHLVAALTNTDLHRNIRNMLKTALAPLALTLIGYGLLSCWHPLQLQDNTVAGEIITLFDIHPATAVPAAIILIASAFRIDVKASMLVSILAGMGVGIAYQQQTLTTMVQFILLGFTLSDTGSFAAIIQGGGLVSMINVAFIVFLSSAYAGLFEGTQMLREIDHFLERVSQKTGVYPTTVLTSTVTAALACNQTLTVILTHQFAARIYEKRSLSHYRLALDLENTAIVIAPLIPWNIAAAFPIATLGADASCIFFAFYLFLIPLVNGCIRPASLQAVIK